jgi:hypothetical protein
VWCVVCGVWCVCGRALPAWSCNKRYSDFQSFDATLRAAAVPAAAAPLPSLPREQSSSSGFLGIGSTSPSEAGE